MKKQVNFSEFQSMVGSDQALQDKLKTDPINALNEFEPRDPRNDIWSYRAAIVLLGTIIMMCVAALCWNIEPIGKSKDITIIFNSVLSISITGLVAVISRKSA
jgi:hypothetical protein